MQNKNDNAHDFFQSQIHELNTEEMPKGHQDRFLERLVIKQQRKKRSLWFRYGGIAASLIFFMFLFMFNQSGKKQELQQDFPLELTEARIYFDGVIEKELSKIKSYENDSNKILIADTLNEFQKLKNEEEALLKQLSVQYNRRIVKALIANFQIKIDLLESVSLQIEKINQIKNEYHENNL